MIVLCSMAINFTSKNFFLNFGGCLVVSAIWCGNIFSTLIPRCSFGGIKVAVKRGETML